MNSITAAFILFAALFLFVTAFVIIKEMHDKEHIYEKGLIAVVVFYGSEDVNQKICSIIRKFQWVDEELLEKIIIIDGGLNMEQKEICLNYCSRYDYLEFTTPDNLNNMIFELQKNKVKSDSI